MTNTAASESSSYAVFQSVISQTLQDKEQLPSLPALTLKIRQAVSNPNVDHQLLSDLIIKDPSLTAIILKCASSPLYKTQQLPNTLRDTIALLGLETVNNLIMAHSLNSMFIMKSPYLKKMFKRAWRRLLLKTGICRFLSQELRYRPVEHPMLASLLSEIGTLLLISALNDAHEPPDETVYLKLCRDYSKKLGGVILKKWNMDERFYDVITYSGNWSYSSETRLTLVDLVNLSLYHSIGFQRKGHTLPPITTLSAYKKLPIPANKLDKSGRLCLVSLNQEKIQAIITALS
jgi:HD-like signal output (HDOD) protein